jgi:hypothetical protein
MSQLGQSRHIQRTPKTNFVRYTPVVSTGRRNTGGPAGNKYR